MHPAPAGLLMHVGYVMSVRRAVLLAWLAAVAPLGPLQSQQSASLRGRVTDGAGQPVADAQVSIPATGRAATTDAAGAWRLGDLAPGVTEVLVRRIGYSPAVRRVTLGAGETVLDVVLARQATTLEPVVTTATRDAASITDIPAAVSVADSFVIKQSRTAGLHEVLRTVPGVQATSRFGLDDVNLSIRGSGIRTTFGVRGVAVLVDGVPITEPDGLTRLDLIELASARQVEVVRGPASTLYGGTAAGGAINVITRSGVESKGVTARLQRGDYGFEKYDASVATGFDRDRGAVYLSGTWTDQDGFRAFNGNSMTRFTLRSEYRPAARTRVTLEGNTSSLDMNIPGALTQAEFDTDPFQAVQTPNVVNQYARRDSRWRLGTRLEQGFTLGAPIDASAYFFYGGRTLDHPIFQVVVQDLARVQGGGRVRIPFGNPADPRLRLTLGADYDRLSGDDLRYQNVQGERGRLLQDNDQVLPTFGTYGQAELAVTSRLSLTGGLRYDRVEYDITDNLVASRSFVNVFDQWSPKGTAAYRVGKASSVYASVSRGFEVPTSGEFAFSPDPDEAYNRDLRPKTLWNYEVGLKSVLGDRVALDVALYQADIEGELLGRTIQTPTGPRAVFENAGTSRNRGVELGATVLATPWLDVVGAYTFSDFVLTDFQALSVNSAGQSVLTDYSGNRLPGVPRHRVSGELRLRPLRGLSASLAGEWQGLTYVDNGNRVEGTVYFRPFGSPNVAAVPFRAVADWALLHASARYEINGAGFFLAVENLLDARYSANITVNDGTGRFYNTGAGRYISAGVSLSALPHGGR